MILKAKHHSLIFPVFQWYTRWSIKQFFNKVVREGELPASRKPLLLIANHVSWWDGFWALYLNMVLFKRKFHFMMQEDQLRKYWFFNYCGGFSVRRNSRTAIETIDYAVDLLMQENNLVLMFPQGKIESMYKYPFMFENGVERIANRLNPEKFQIVMLANLVDYHSHRKPTLFQYVGLYKGDDYSSKSLEVQYNHFYCDCLGKQLKITD